MAGVEVTANPRIEIIEALQVQLSFDKESAAPGETVRLTFAAQNRASAPITDLAWSQTLTDELPGLESVIDSIRRLR